jgi:carbohydrate-selective porin OprB
VLRLGARAEGAEQAAAGLQVELGRLLGENTGLSEALGALRVRVHSYEKASRDMAELESVAARERGAAGRALEAL